MQKLVEIRRFDNPVEAHVLCDLLWDAGIPARVFDEHVGTALPHYGMIGVRVVVRAEDVARAETVIAEEKAARKEAPEGAAEEIPWRDRGAGEEKEMPGPGEEGAEGVEVEEEEKNEEEEEPRPRRLAMVQASRSGSATSPEGAEREAATLAWATRTRLFALLGVACFFFSFGALFRMMDTPPDVASHPEARRRLRQARILAWGMIAVVGTSAVALWIALYLRGRG